MRPVLCLLLLALTVSPLPALQAGAPAAPGALAPEVKDYLMIFTADSARYNPTKAHTFAALVSVEEAPGCPARAVERVSMSWLPQTMKVRALAVRPETGRNVPLEETLRYYLGTGSRVCRWGPYHVRPELARTFKARVAAVESRFKYQGACLLARLEVCDCARSVEEMLHTGGLRRRFIGVCGYGAAAGSHIVRKFSPWLIEPERTHHWVATLIGLDEIGPVVCRPYGDYSSRWDQLRAAFRRK